MASAGSLQKLVKELKLLFSQSQMLAQFGNTMTIHV